MVIPAHRLYGPSKDLVTGWNKRWGGGAKALYQIATMQSFLSRILPFLMAYEKAEGDDRTEEMSRVFLALSKGQI